MAQMIQRPSQIPFPETCSKFCFQVCFQKQSIQLLFPEAKMVQSALLHKCMQLTARRRPRFDPSTAVLRKRAIRQAIVGLSSGLKDAHDGTCADYPSRPEQLKETAPVIWEVAGPLRPQPEDEINKCVRQ